MAISTCQFRATSQQKGELAYRTPPRPVHNTDAVRDLIHERVAATDGRITAKRLLPRARAMGYAGSARNFRRAVAEIKAAYRHRRRVYRPWVPSIGEHLVSFSERHWPVSASAVKAEPRSLPPESSMMSVDA